MTINEKQEQIIDDFSLLDDWMDRYATLIDKGNSLPPMDEKYKTPQNLIEGCQSRVWLHADYENNIITFYGSLSESQYMISYTGNLHTSFTPMIPHKILHKINTFI